MLPNTQRFFDELGALGYTGTIDDRLHAFLAAELGVTGTNNDLLNAYLGSLGYTGSLADKVAAFIATGNDLAPVFDPATLFAAGEKGWWYDPSDLSTLFQDAAGTTPVTAVGQPVGRMNDKSGNGEYIVQRTDASRPILRQDAKGKYYLEGLGGWMSTQTPAGTNRDVTFGGAAKACWFYAAWVNGASYGFHYGGNSSGLTSLYFNPTHRHFVQAGVSATTTLEAGNITYNAGYIISLIADLSLAANTQSAFDVRRNGVDMVFTGANLSAGTYRNMKFYLMSDDFGSSTLNGRFYGMIVRAAACTAEEIDGVESYMARKSGVTL